MKSMVRLSGLLGCSLFWFSGCAGFEEIENESPTVRMLRGDLDPGEYREAVKQTNERQRAQDALERNRESTRAFNTKSGKFEFVPQDTKQEWNPETERWEFTPEKEE